VPVSPADVAHVRAAFEEFDLGSLRAGGLDAYFARFYTDDAVLEHAEGFPLPATGYAGRDGYRAWFDETYGPYAAVRWVAERVEAVGDRVVVLAWAQGRMADDPTELEVRLANVYTLRDGRIAAVHVYLSPEKAYADARAGS
jgi:ketosteroid isomerase-like protein